MRLLPQLCPEIWVEVVQRSGDGEQHLAHLSVGAFLSHVRQAGHRAFPALLVDGLERLADDDADGQYIGGVDLFPESQSFDDLVGAVRRGVVGHGVVGALLLAKGA